MNKKEMTIGKWYATRYGRSPLVLLSFGGYTRNPYDLLGPRIFVRPTANGSASENLMLQVNTEDAELRKIAASYTEGDYLAGEPVPEGTALICVTSREITMTWEEREAGMHFAAIRAEAKARAEDYQKNVTVPQVMSEMRRLGIHPYFREHMTEVKLSFAEFLDLAARIPTGDG